MVKVEARLRGCEVQSRAQLRSVLGELEERSLRSAADSATASTEPTSAVGGEETSPLVEEEVPADLVASLSKAESRDDIAAAVLGEAGRLLHRSALFIAQADRVIGWAAVPEPPEGLRSFSVAFSEPSLFASLRNTDGFYVGPCPDLPGNRRILEALGATFPAVVAAVPVTLKGKSVLFLLGAARAGEAGAGFAVVADEVRSLAKRAAEAARNTTALLDGSNIRISNGVKQVQFAGEAFEDATEKTRKSTELLRDIASASKEQALGIGQVSLAVQELDKLTQHNAAEADQASNIANDMESQSEQLNQDVETLVTVVRGAGATVDVGAVHEPPFL